MRYRDRRQAGRALALQMAEYVGRGDVVVLALPRGGVPVGFEVAQALHAPLDVFLVRKLGVPWHQELAMGAIASGGVRVLNDEVVRELGIDARSIELVAAREETELHRREQAYRQGRPDLDLDGRTVVVVDDGLATGSSMRAAIVALRKLGPARVIVAVPVAAAETCQELRAIADAVVCTLTPCPFGGVGAWYEDFSQTEDDEVRLLLAQAGRNAKFDGTAPTWTSR